MQKSAQAGSSAIYLTVPNKIQLERFGVARDQKNDDSVASLYGETFISTSFKLIQFN